MHRLVIAGVLSAVALVLVTAASAAPGDLDATFGESGVVRTDVGFIDTASDIAVQPDGRIVAAGTVDESGTRNVFAARYLSDGSPDTSFGGDGVVVSDRYHQVAPRLVVQSDGKVVLATRSEFGGGLLFVYRFNADGTPDTSFGSSGNGTAVLSPPTGTFVVNVAGAGLVADEKIVVALRANYRSGKEVVALARLNEDGSGDTSFGAGGFVIAERSASWTPLGFTLQDDGRMLVAGFAFPPPGRFYLDAFVVRFDATGSLDTSFDGDGIAVLERPTNGTEFQALAVAPDGSVLAGGREWGSIYNQNRWLLAKYTSNGSLDAAFGTGGLTFYDPGTGDDVILDLGATNAGIYATGWSESLAVGLPLALFTEEGALDPDFGSGGLTGVAGQFSRGAWRLDVQTDARVVVFGSIQSFTPTFNQDLYFARYEGGPTDITPPVLNLPSVVNADATGPQGGPVEYSSFVSATDDVDGAVLVSCNPMSGSTFPIGDTVVSCTATDATGNSSTGTFTVHVKGSAEQVDDLLTLVDSFGLGKLGTSLHDKLVTVQRFLAAGKPRQAEDNLEAFINQVETQRGKGLSQEQADALESAAQRIMDVIEP